jgi:hypothetical protein
LFAEPFSLQIAAREKHRIARDERTKVPNNGRARSLCENNYPPHKALEPTAKKNTHNRELPINKSAGEVNKNRLLIANWATAIFYARKTCFNSAKEKLAGAL